MFLSGSLYVDQPRVCNIFFLESESRPLLSFNKSNDLPFNKDSQESATKTKLLIISR